MHTQENSRVKDLTKGNVFQTLLLFSIPFMISTILQTLYSTIDMMIVGNVVGKAGLSALSTGSQLMEMIAILCVGFSTAGQVLISQYMGAGRIEDVRKVIRTLSFLMILIAAVLTGAGVFGCDTFLKLLNTPDKAFSYAHQYVTICCMGILFTCLYNMISAIFRGMGDSRHPLVFIAIASVVNIVLDIIFVCEFQMGAAGAAIATVIGQAVSVLCSITFLLHHQDTYYFSLRLKDFRIEGKIVAALFKLGIPMALQSSAVYISFLFVSSIINSIGVDVSAAFGAAQKIRNIPNTFTQAIGLGATAMVGQNFGARKMDRVQKIYRTGCAINMAFCLVAALVLGIFPRQAFMLFTKDTQVLVYAKMAIFCIIIELPAKTFLPSGHALINGCGNVRLSVILGICDAFAGRILLTVLLGRILGFGVNGYFMGYCLATYVTAIPQVMYYLSGKWKNRQVV
jgi:putative MATE family efflux protein